MRYEYEVIENVLTEGQHEEVLAGEENLKDTLNGFGEDGYRLVRLLPSPGGIGFLVVLERKVA